LVSLLLALLWATAAVVGVAGACWAVAGLVMGGGIGSFAALLFLVGIGGLLLLAIPSALWVHEVVPDAP
jgi:hypothetical protein